MKRILILTAGFGDGHNAAAQNIREAVDLITEEASVEVLDRFESTYGIDAWEIANRNNLFTPVGLKRLAYLANSDFHKPKHIYSWKTILHCEKTPEAIKDCIRQNQRVSLTLYRDGLSGQALRAEPARTVSPAWADEVMALPDSRTAA